jgi:hypothetical protein
MVKIVHSISVWTMIFLFLSMRRKCDLSNQSFSTVSESICKIVKIQISDLFCKYQASRFFADLQKISKRVDEMVHFLAEHSLES